MYPLINDMINYNILKEITIYEYNKKIFK